MKWHTRLIGTTAVATMLLAAGCESGGGSRSTGSGGGGGSANLQPAGDAAPLRLAAENPQETLPNRRADLNSPINAADLASTGMKLAWKVQTDEPVSHRPLVGEGRVFFADWGGTVYAVDASSGNVLWQKQVEQPKKMWPWHGFAGTGILGEGMLFEASVEGNAFGLNQDTGEVVWQTKFADDPQAGNVGDLLYHDGLVYIGLSSVEEPLDKMIDKKKAGDKGLEPNFQGKVVALNARTGKPVWQRQLVQKPHNGVPVWCSFALDPQTNTLFFATGNNYTGEASELSDAVVAVDAKSGEIRWAKQVTQQDVWTMENPIGPDYDFGAGPQLFEAGGRQLVGAGQKSGIFWVFDRKSGELVWYTTVGYGGVGGGIHAEASIGDGTVYVWSNNAYEYGKPPEKMPMNVKALDAATGKMVWSKPKSQPANLSATGFLANDVYFVPALDGKVYAYRTSDGKQIWTSPAHASVLSPAWVSDNALLFGTGTPKRFGTNKGATGVFAYSTAADAAGPPRRTTTRPATTQATKKPAPK